MYNNYNNDKKVLEYLVYKDLVLVYITLELVLHAAKCSSKSGRVHDGSKQVRTCSHVLRSRLFCIRGVTTKNEPLLRPR